jgi:hypothetical protein
LVDLYGASGMNGVAAKAAEYGVTPKYVANAASGDQSKSDGAHTFASDQRARCAAWANC